MRKRFESIFENLSDKEFEDVLNECGFKFKKVEGKGGLKINGENISSEMLRKEALYFENKIKSVNYIKKDQSPSIGVFCKFNDFEFSEKLNLSLLIA